MNDIEQVKKLITQPKLSLFSEQLREIAQNPNTSAEIFTLLVEEFNKTNSLFYQEITKSIALNPNIPSELLEKLLMYHSVEVLNNPTILRRLKEQPNLLYLLETNYSRVKTLIEYNYDVPNWFLERLTNLKNFTVKKEFDREITTIAQQILEAKNESTPPAKLVELGEKSTFSIRRFVALNPNTLVDTLIEVAYAFPKEVLNNPVFDLLILEDADFIKRIPPETFIELLCQEEMTSSFLALAIEHPEDRVKSHIAIDPATSPKTLQRLLENILAGKGSLSLSRSIANNPNISTETLQLLTDRSKDVTLAKHTIYCSKIKIPTETIEQLIENGDEKLLEAIALNPNTPTHIIENLCSSYINKSYTNKNYKIIYAISQNPKTNSQILESITNKYISDNNPHLVRDLLLNIASHDNASSQTLERLADYPDEWATEAVAVNSNVSEKTIEKILIKVVNSLFAQKSQEEKLALLVLAFDELQKAKNTQTSISLLEQYTKHRWRAIRLAVAKNPSTPDSILQQLANDGYPKVAEWVAKHPNCSSYTLDILNQYPATYIHQIALKHPNISRLTKQRSYSGKSYT